MKRIAYFACARNSKNKIEQLFVERRDGKPYSQEWTGIIYKDEKDAFVELGKLNQRLAHSILS